MLSLQDLKLKPISMSPWPRQPTPCIPSITFPPPVNYPAPDELGTYDRSFRKDSSPYYDLPDSYNNNEGNYVSSGTGVFVYFKYLVHIYQN